MSVYGDEPCDVYDERELRARVEHRCDACHERIALGSTYWRIGIVFDGSAETVKRCQRCQAIHVHLRPLMAHDAWPDERLDCGMSYEEEHGELPPEIAALAFALPDDIAARDAS